MKGEQLVLGFRPLTALGQEDFQIAACNTDAVRWLEIWPQWPCHTMILWGPVGCGKTHLLSILADRHQTKIISATELLSDNLPCGHIILIDDLETLKDEEALFHLWNRTNEEQGFLVLSSHKPPAQMNISLQDLRSRLMASLVVEIGLPDDSLLEMVLAKHFHDRQVKVSSEVISLVVARAERSFASMQKIAQLLDQVALQQKKAITLSLTRHVLLQVT